MPPAQGYNSYVSFIEESVFGTDPGGARDFYCRLIRDTLKKTKNFQPYPGMAGPGIRKRFAGNTVVVGEIELEFHFEGPGKLLKWACGASGYTFDDDSPVPDSATHTIKPGSNVNLDSFSMEISRGDMPAGKVFLYTGCIIDSVTIEWANQSLVKFTIGIIAQEETPDTSEIATPAFASDHPVLWHFVGTAQIAAVTPIAMKSGRITMNNNMQKDRFLMSQQISEPGRADNRVVEGECMAEFDSAIEYAAFNSEVDAALALSIISDEMVTGATPFQLDIDAASSQFSAVEANVEGPGPIDLPLTFHVNGANEEITFMLINDEATYA